MGPLDPWGKVKVYRVSRFVGFRVLGFRFRVEFKVLLKSLLMEPRRACDCQGFRLGCVCVCLCVCARPFVHVCVCMCVCVCVSVSGSESVFMCLCVFVICGWGGEYVSPCVWGFERR